MREMTSVMPATTLEKFAQLADLLKQASLLAREISQNHEQLSHAIPEEQKWFWTKEWQAAEREVDDQLAGGEYEEFDSMEEAIAYLHQQV